MILTDKMTPVRSFTASLLPGGLLAAASLALVLVLSGCAGTGTGTPTSAATAPVPEQTVEERAQARWDHIVARDFAAAWAFYTPGYRLITPQPEFIAMMAGRPVVWEAAEVRSSECAQPDRCTVTSLVAYRVPNAPTGINQMTVERELREEWLYVEGQWWFVQN